MTVECFVDTNVLVYAAAGRGRYEDKRRRALDLLDTHEVGLSAQVLQEFYVTVVRKVEVPLSAAEAMEWLEQLAAFPCLPVDRPLVETAVGLSELHRISYWDAAILAAAEALEAPLLYTEDLAHGRRYGAVTAVDPFRDPE